MKYEGFAELPAKRVLEACKQFKLRRAERIAAEWDRCVEAEMTRRWFRPKSREAAIKRIKDRDMFCDFGLAELRGGYEASIVDEVESLAAAASGTVLLSSKAAHILRDDLAA